MNINFVQKQNNMNRIILIGNGFDLAHNLPTKYEQFIIWYWEQWESVLRKSEKDEVNDSICSFGIASDDKSIKDFIERFSELRTLKGLDFIKTLRTITTFIIKECRFLSDINKSIETKRWVDIEDVYYRLLKMSADSPKKYNFNAESLNKQLCFLQTKLIEYLSRISIDDKMKNNHIHRIIYGPIKYKDISVSETDKLILHYKKWMTCTDSEWIMRLGLYGFKSDQMVNINEYRKHNIVPDDWTTNYVNIQACPELFLYPDNIMLLNFNYTDTAKLYLPIPKPGFEINHIHGELSKPESVIFGYGDELDENYKKISNLNDNEYLNNFKSFKYLESDRYRKALQFMDAAPYQVYIMGHSCGNSDRTLLNTLFEHRNCVSIKPYYFKDGDKDNYLDIVQNISRSFNDKKLMRDRVVNKTFCEPFSSI